MTTNKTGQEIIEGLIACGVYEEVHDNNPTKALQDLIEISITMALDPAISERAQALVDRGMRYQRQSWKGLTQNSKMHLWESYRDPACTKRHEDIMDDVEQLLKERNT